MPVLGITREPKRAFSPRLPANSPAFDWFHQGRGNHRPEWPRVCDPIHPFFALAAVLLSRGLPPAVRQGAEMVGSMNLDPHTLFVVTISVDAMLGMLLL